MALHVIEKVVRWVAQETGMPHLEQVDSNVVLEELYLFEFKFNHIWLFFFVKLRFVEKFCTAIVHCIKNIFQALFCNYVVIWFA